MGLAFPSKGKIGPCLDGVTPDLDPRVFMTVSQWDLSA